MTVLRTRAIIVAIAALGIVAAAARDESAASDDRAAVTWLKRASIPIATVNPDAPEGDLTAVGIIVGDARIVGAGEATHGSREFFQMKDRLFRHLVRSRGFTGFAIEANFADGEAINDYVHGGPGDPEKMLAAMHYWTWDTEEVLALIRWMRAYNASHSPKLSFYAIDIQYAPANLEMAMNFLRGAGVGDSQWRAPLAPYLEAAKDIAAGYKETNSYSPEKMAEVTRAAADLFQYFEHKRDTLIARSGRAAYLRARSAALAGAWYFVMQARPEAWRFTAFRNEYDVRDRAMADMAEAALGREGDGKLFLWAHNAHVSKQRQLDGRKTAGLYLAEDLGSAYLSIGFAFDRGTFQAFPPKDPDRPDAKPRLTEMRVRPAPTGSSEAVLRQVAAPIWAVDLRKLDPGTPAYRWFAARRRLFWTGAAYSAELEAKHPPISLTESHDVLIFIDHTTRARPLEFTRKEQGVAKDW